MFQKKLFKNFKQDIIFVFIYKTCSKRLSIRNLKLYPQS